MLGGLFIIVILIVIAFAFFSMGANGELDERYVSQEYFDNSMFGDYMGGFKHVSVSDTTCVRLLFLDNKIRFIFQYYKNIIGYVDVDANNIKDVRYMNERFLSESLSLGKMVCFGFLSLAMKDKKVENKEYIVIDLEYEGEQLSIVIEPTLFKQELINKVREYVLVKA